VDNVLILIGKQVCQIAFHLGLYDFDRTYCMSDYSVVGAAALIVILACVLLVGISIKILQGI
jgi:hypothetical protein